MASLPTKTSPSTPTSTPTRTVRTPARVWTVFVTPTVVLIGVFVIYPMVDTIGISFTDFDGLSPGSYVGADNYTALPENDVFGTAMRNSLWIAGTVTVALTCLPLPIAYWIHRKVPFRRFFRAALYIPVVLPIIVSSVAWKFILDDRGLLNALLGWTGLREYPIGWLSDPDVAIWSVIFVIIWRSLGIYLLIYLGYLLTIPDELFEAATVDGAGGARTFFSIVCPLMKPAILLCTVVSFANSMKAFDEIYVLTSGGPVNSTKNAAYLIWETAFENFEFGAASAMAIVLLLTVAVVVSMIFLVGRRRLA